MNKIRHVLGISGGKDSAALAIYLNLKYPQLNIDYYFCDTGKELQETYLLIERLESLLGKSITTLIAEDAKQNPSDNPFDHFFKIYRGYLPSSTARWCTKKLKLEPFEKYVGESPVISYVGIRGDENREGYISKKSNIQSIFPFRKNIWSEDVINKVMHPTNNEWLMDVYSSLMSGRKLDKVNSAIFSSISSDVEKAKRLSDLLDVGVVEFNKAVFSFMKNTDYPLALEEDFPLLENDEVLVREDIFRILRESGVGVPEYYEKIKYEVDGKSSEYARSRSGCYFCFFQQKIEWIWLYEQHPDLFEKAMQYENEKEGFTWNQHESLDDLIQPSRMEQIKRDHLLRKNKEKSIKSPYLLDILDDTESDGCTACFI
ncbi:MAG TPA: phosphoadenosine phosphosulfate reductase family protein [Bacteroidia bacterium]|nr:phosphoadenosine phosphosulfate reductase family protein [Bacteroidia bacterium]